MSKPVPQFQPEMVKGGRWFVAVKTGNGPDSHVGDFETEAEAKHWISTKSKYWPGKPDAPKCPPGLTSLHKPPTGWKRLFENPIDLPRGRQLVTLKDAADYIMKLPKAKQRLETWQTATEALRSWLRKVAIS